MCADFLPFSRSHQTNLYVKSRRGRPDELAVLSSVSWQVWLESKGDVYSAKIKDEQRPLADYPFIALPMLNDSHWTLVIFAYVSDLAASFTAPRRTAIILLDSLKYPYSPFEGQLRLFAIRIALEAFGEDLDWEVSAKVEIHQPRVSSNLLIIHSGRHPHPVVLYQTLRQTDVTDCGFYPAHFLGVFMSDASAFFDHCTVSHPEDLSVPVC